MTLRLGYFPNITHATALVGVGKGIFEEKLADNVTLETSTFSTGTEASEALFADAIDMTYIGPNPAINAYAKSDGAAVRVISGATSGGAFLVVKPEINSPADLKGKVLATPSLGNTQDVALRSWLKENGLSSDEAGGGDVSIAPQENSQTLQTFLSGDIQGAWVPEPWATRLIQEGGGKVLVDERDLWPEGQYVTTHVMVATKFLDEHPDVVQQFLEGHVAANCVRERQRGRGQVPRQHGDRGDHRQAAEGRDHRRRVAEPDLHRRPGGELTDRLGRGCRGRRPAGAGRQPRRHLRPHPAQPGAGRRRPAAGGRAVTTTVLEPRVLATVDGDTRVGLHAVTKRFGNGDNAVLALDRVSLQVRAGEFVCLVGASGCGKTTLLNLVAGLDQPSSGEVFRSGRSGLMFQEAALFPWLSVGKNVELPLRLRGVPRSQRRPRVVELLELVRLEGFIDKQPHQLSGGMRQRVALARALAQEADVLLMDEPFGALDAMTRDVMHDELERIWRETGSTILFVTHNVREAARLADRIVLLTSRPGRVAAEFVVDIDRPRRIEAPDVSALTGEVTARLREEVARHGHR